jgi:hypothetical protein
MCVAAACYDPQPVSALLSPLRAVACTSAFIALIVLVLVPVASAADTGSVSGLVLDPGGAAIQAATVRISGDGLPVGRAVQTDVNGAYKLEYLLPGNYVLEIDKAGTSVRREAVVSVGKDTQVDVILGAAVAEQLTVRAAAPIVDVRSSEVSFNFNAETLAALPLERSYRGLFQLMPGVPENRSSVGPAAGGSRQDNTYLIDGVNITNPAFGYLSTEISELDIAEVNMKRAGISAEFGRAAGSVTNAVSRSGTNRLSGIARMDLLPSRFVGAYSLPDDLLAAGVRPGTFRDQLLTTELSPSAGVGGPVLRDRLFFYGSARYSRQAKWDRFNKVGAALPDEVRSGAEFYGKLTGAPTPAHQINVSYRHRPTTIENNLLTSDYAPGVAVTSDDRSGIAMAEWASFMSSGALDIRYLFFRENNDDRPVTSLGMLPAFDPGNLSAMGQYTDPSQANLVVGGSQYSVAQKYKRHELRATITRFTNLGPTSHVFKAGAGYELAEESLNRLANGWGLIASINQSGVPALRARYYTPQPPQIGQGRTYSMFAQDEITAGRRLSVNLGLLMNRDDFAQELRGSNGCPVVSLQGGAAVYESDGDTCHFLRFGLLDEVQPRIGLTYRVRENAGDKAYGTWGRYYNMDQKSSGRSLAPNRIFQTQTIFDLNGNVLSTGPLASTTGKLIDPDIKPTYTDEFVLGYATPFAERYSLDLFFMSRSLNNIIEDVPTRQNGTAPDSPPFAASNLPCDRFASCQDADAERTYRAFTVDVRRHLSQGLMTDVSYTWSRFEGNYDIDYGPTPVFNTSSFIQDGPGTNVQDPNRFGPLFEDRPHVFKLFATYAATSRLTTSGFVRVQSGTPWAARGRDWEGAALNYLEPAGSHRNPVWTNLDLMASYRMPIAGRANLSLEARALNVTNAQTRLATDSQQFLDLRTIPAPPYFAPYQQPNPFFGLGSSFAPPRRLVIGATASF